MKILIKSHLLLVKDILATDLDKINLGNDNDFDENDCDTIIHVRHLAWCSKFKKCKVLKKIFFHMLKLHTSYFEIKKMTQTSKKL